MNTFYRRNRADGWSGVIIITRKNLNVEKIGPTKGEKW